LQTVIRWEFCNRTGNARDTAWKLSQRRENKLPNPFVCRACLPSQPSILPRSDIQTRNETKTGHVPEQNCNQPAAGSRLTGRAPHGRKMGATRVHSIRVLAPLPAARKIWGRSCSSLQAAKAKKAMDIFQKNRRLHFASRKTAPTARLFR
jgi:hypothetical protein